MNFQCRVSPRAAQYRAPVALPAHCGRPIAVVSIERVRGKPEDMRRQRFLDEITVAILFLLGGLLLLTVTWSSLYSDGISYLRIGEHLLAGRFDESVNGYWGPLYSWLLVPLLGLGVDGAVALRLVNLGAGAGALAGFRQLAFQLGAAPRLVNMVSLGVAAYLWAQSLNSEEGLTPDVLLAALLSWYLVFLGRRPRRARTAAAAGLFAGAAYLSKSYALPFFLFHIAGVCAADLWMVRRRGAWKRPLSRFAAAVACFSLLAAPWAGIISAHYGRLAFGFSGSYNLGLMHPDALHPMYTEGLIEPPTPHGVSAWDDPSLLPMTDWRWWHSLSDFKIGLQGMTVNVRKMFLDFERRCGVAFSLALVMAAFLPFDGWGRRRRRQLTFLLLTAALYVGGYVLTAKFLSHRYVILAALLFTVCALFFAEQIRRGSSGRAPLALLLAGAITVSMAVSAGALLLDEYWGGRPGALRLRAIAEELRTSIPPGSRIASDENWHDSLDLSYWLDGRYYGLPVEGDREAQLRGRRIDFLLIWAPALWPQPPGRTMPSAWEGPPIIYDQR